MGGGGISVATVEQLIDPISGLVVVNRINGGPGVSASTRTVEAPFRARPDHDASGSAIARAGQRG